MFRLIADWREIRGAWKAHRSLSTHWGERVGVNAAELRMQLFSLAPASGERVGVGAFRADLPSP